MKESALKHMENMGYSPNLVAHVEMQLPELIVETIKRIKYAPFPMEHSAIVYSNDRNSALLWHLANMALATAERPYLPRLSFSDDTLTMKALHDYMDVALQDHRRVPILPVLSLHPKNLHEDVVILSPETANDPQLVDRPVKVRGHDLPRYLMPLYLERGEHNLPYVYPLFDWSELQLLTGFMHFNLDVNLLKGK